MYIVRKLRVMADALKLVSIAQRVPIPAPVYNALLAYFWSLEGDGGGGALVANPRPNAWRVRAANLAVDDVLRACADKP